MREREGKEQEKVEESGMETDKRASHDSAGQGTCHTLKSHRVS